ncbi:hypothetical protein D1007_15777 [Hordeum vulgare]|nr:hypothetical protein D1007_15777 [Hordeum vulgare]
MVYTNDPVLVENSIHIMEQSLADDKYKVVDFDLEYTGGRAGHDQKVVVAQLCMGHYVLIYHYCLAIRPCERFASEEKHKDSPVDLAMAIIDPYYRGMKDVCKKKKVAWHRPWVRRVDEDHIKYAAKDTYVSYGM